MRYIRRLSTGEISSLEDGYRNGKKHYFRIKCKSILLSHEGKTINEIAAFAEKTPRTIRNWFNVPIAIGIEKNGIKEFVVKPGRGIKAVLDNLKSKDIKFIKTEVEKNYQSLNTVCAVLSKEFGFEVTKWMLKRFLKKNSITHGEGLEKI